MRDKNHIQKFIKTSLKVVRRRVATSLRSEVLRTPVGASTTLVDSSLVYGKKFFDLFEILVCLHELPEEVKWEVKLDLEERDFLEFSVEQRVSLETLLQLESTEEVLLYLREEHDLFDFFGRLGSRRGPLEIRRKFARRPKRIQRRRGYSDKGTLSPSDPTKDYMFDVLFQEKVQINEMKLILQSNYITIKARNNSLRIKFSVLKML